MAEKRACQYCGKEYSEKFINAHEKKCELNPDNMVVQEEKVEIVEDTPITIVEEPVKAEPIVTPAVKTSAIKTRVQLDRNMLVPVMNSTLGEVYYTSKQTGREWAMLGYGDIVEIELAELTYMKSAHPRYLNKPVIIIIGDHAEEVVEYLGIQKLYENILTPDDLENFFRQNIDYKKLVEMLKKFPDGMKQLIIHTAREKIEANDLHDFMKIKAIEETFNIQLLDR